MCPVQTEEKNTSRRRPQDSVSRFDFDIDICILYLHNIVYIILYAHNNMTIVILLLYM